MYQTSLLLTIPIPRGYRFGNAQSVWEIFVGHYRGRLKFVWIPIFKMGLMYRSIRNSHMPPPPPPPCSYGSSIFLSETPVYPATLLVWPDFYAPMLAVVTGFNCTPPPLPPPPPSPGNLPGIWTFQFSCGQIPHPGVQNPFKCPTSRLNSVVKCPTGPLFPRKSDDIWAEISVSSVFPDVTNRNVMSATLNIGSSMIYRRIW